MTYLISQAQHASKTAHLPSILGIALPNSQDSDVASVNSCNVSVLFAHFASARNALLVIMSEASDANLLLPCK